MRSEVVHWNGGEYPTTYHFAPPEQHVPVFVPPIGQGIWVGEAKPIIGMVRNVWQEIVPPMQLINMGQQGVIGVDQSRVQYLLPIPLKVVEQV